MRRAINLIVLLFIIITINSASSYNIYYKAEIAGKYIIDYNYPYIRETALWTDGFSAQFSQSEHNFGSGYSYQSLSYIKDNTLPNSLHYESNVLDKRIGTINAHIKIKENVPFIIENSLPFGAVMFVQRNGISDLFSVTKDAFVKVKTEAGQIVSIDNIPVYVYGDGIYPDSIIWAHYTLKKTNAFSYINNPYSKGRVFKKSDFTKKPLHKIIRIGDIRGELCISGSGGDLVVILPFDIRSDRYGNTYNAKVYTAYQLAESIHKNVFIFDFIGLKDFNVKSVMEQLRVIDSYFSAYYDNIHYIAFNDMLPIAVDVFPERHIIGINPPVTDYDLYQSIVFGKYNKYSDFMYSSVKSFKVYNIFNNYFAQTDFIKLYNQHRHLKLIFSFSALNESETEKLMYIKCKYSKIKNIDRRLNSYIIGSDFWSFRTNIYINKSILQYINNQL